MHSMSANRNVRKFIDLVRRVSGKWTNWDPPIPIAVGDYGELDGNGELVVEGNIYTDPEIQQYLNDNGFNLDLEAYQPEAGDPEQDYIVASTGVKKGQLNVDQSVNIPTVVSASIKGTWKFQDGKRGALIILHKPLQRFVPKVVLSKLLKVQLLEGKHIVTSALACPAYLMYLSDKAGETFSVAFCAKTAGVDAVNAEVGAGWWTDSETALLRRGFNPKGEHRFTPLFSLQQKAKPTWLRWRGAEDTDSSDEYVWQDVYPAWKPLDEDGEEYDD